MNKTAIVGVDIAFGPCADLESFARTLYAGEQVSSRTQLPLSAAELGLRVANNALFDANIGRGGRVAVCVCAQDAAGLAQQLVDLWAFGASHKAFPAGEAAIGEAFVAARELLAGGDVDAALLLAVDARGAGALVLAPMRVTSPHQVYAVVDALQVGTQGEAQSLCRAALAEAGVTAGQVGYLETSALPLDAGVLATYRTPQADLTCALGSAAVNFGSASLIASVIKTVLSLQRRTLLPLPGWSGPAEDGSWRDSPFYVASAARPWFAASAAQPRVAALSALAGPLCVQLILSEPVAWRAGEQMRPQLGTQAIYLFPFAAHDRGTIEAHLQNLREQIGSRAAPLPSLARRAFAAYQQDAAAPYALALVGCDHAALLREIDFALAGVTQAFESGRPWRSPQGSYFTADPQGERGVAFVYPGAFNSYVGLGRDLLQHFPGLHERLTAVVSNPGQAFAERLLYPRSLQPSSAAAEEAAVARLTADPVAMIESGTVMAMLYTMLLRDSFGVQPQVALGYSLGEISMLWSCGVWRSGDAGSSGWHASPLFTRRLFGAKEAVREYWGLDAQSADDFWHTYILKAPLEKVRTAVADEFRVYLTLINLKNEAVIAGDAQGCRRVIAGLDCHALRVPFDAVIHNPAMRSEHDAFAALATHPIYQRPETAFYSAARYAPLELESDALAQAIAEMTCHPVDFPKLINAAYAGGARVFVELGPLGTCTRWIRRILRGQDHAAVAINSRGKEDLAGVLAVLALLVSQRVTVDLAALYAPSPRAGELAMREGSHPTADSRLPGGAALGVASPSAARRYVLPSDTAVRDYADNLSRHAARLNEGHAAFLDVRRAALQQTGALLRMQTAVAAQMLDVALESVPLLAEIAEPRPLFDEAAIKSLACGELEDCFGADYACYRGRRVPRLPNGDLRLLSRVLSIEGQRGVFDNRPSMISECDVPADAWFYRERAAANLPPYAVLMEIALQPCGFLAAYLGSTLPYADVDFYFRNLDGSGRIVGAPDLRGKTVTQRAVLLSSTAVPGIIIQKYVFELACEGACFYQGTASFGYFSPEALMHQKGLDGGKATPPWLTPERASSVPVEVVDLRRAPRGHLALLDEVRVVEGGGQFDKGYVSAAAALRLEDWFFACHFYQDPVMPGSLGVEAILQAMQVYAQACGLAQHLRGPVVAQLDDHETLWTYRGQITPQNRRFHLEVHIERVEVRADCVTVVGDASLWKENLRIYEVRHVALRLVAAH